jgi:hypothetical protein
MALVAGTPYWQVAQRSATRAEVRLKDSRTMQESERTAVGDYVRHVLGKDVDVTVNTVEEFSRSQGGKFYPVVREF